MDDKFSERLRQLRKNKKLTQKQLADKLGVAKSTVSSLETGGSPSLDLLHDLSIALDAKVEYLLGLEDRQWISVDGLSERNIDKIENMINDYKRSNEK